MQYCTRCVFPSVAKTPITFDDDGVCSGCRAAESKKHIDWPNRKKSFEKLIDGYRVSRGYDCVLPVSGGKDSYFAAHLANEFGLNALMVTYHGNNYLPEGEQNLNRMREVFGFDHIIFKPSVDTLIKLNLAGFKKDGDMNWHNHAGLYTYPMQIAIKYNIPLVFWGDHGFTEQGGMYSHQDFFEYTAKDRYEHALHGYDWFDFVGEEGLTEKNLDFLIYPDDHDILRVGLRGIYLSNYFYYDGAKHATLAADKYSWKASEQQFDRTFKKISNIDDMHENGAHDYMKFIKVGYGRGTDHANYDIREGRMTRDEGIKAVLKYDHVKPRDLLRWFHYVGMSEEEFDKIADSFRDSRVWSFEDGAWTKQCIDGVKRRYPNVNLT